MNEELPSDSSIGVYDYLSDSDLDDVDECSRFEEECVESTDGDSPESLPNPQAQDPGPQTLATTPPEQPLSDTNEAQVDNRLASGSLGPSKVSD